MDTRETGIIGHEYPLDSNRRAIFGQFGREELVGLGNQETVHHLKTNWLNLGGRVGYVVCRHGARSNLMRYHDQTDGFGRVPKLQEWFSLVGDANPGSSIVGSDWACVVTFLNQTPQETADWADRVQFEVAEHVATCDLGDDVVRVDFARLQTRIIEDGSEK